MSQLHVFSGTDDFVVGAAEFIVGSAQRAMLERERFTLVLSGGGTPRPIYAHLASPSVRDRLDWSRIHVFWGDERCVPPDDARSNYRMVREVLLDKVPLPLKNVHRIRGEDEPALEALRYEGDLAEFFRTPNTPAFDLILLGLGDNGHTASLFPGTAVLRERERKVVAQYVEVMREWRVTFTAPLINAAYHVVFLVEGAAKADMLANVHHGEYQPDVWPAQMIDPSRGELHWLTDTAAAARLVDG
ncbi:MAG: 6-phosphogluconolactonase [Anaerolineae bacterium]